jgi:hypothetical protein
LKQANFFRHIEVEKAANKVRVNSTMPDDYPIRAIRRDEKLIPSCVNGMNFRLLNAETRAQ